MNQNFENIEMEHKVCASCVMDTTDTALTFDEQGVCPR